MLVAFPFLALRKTEKDPNPQDRNELVFVFHFVFSTLLPTDIRAAYSTHLEKRRWPPTWRCDSHPRKSRACSAKATCSTSFPALPALERHSNCHLSSHERKNPVVSRRVQAWALL